MKGPPDFSYVADNMTTGTPSVNPGVAIVAAANNTMPTATASGCGVITRDCEYLHICAGGFFTAATNVRVLLDVVIDPAGGTTWNTTTILVPKLIFGWTATNTGEVHPGINYEFPVRVPAGATLGFRAQTSHTSTDTGTVQIKLYGGNSNPGSFYYGQKVVEVGITEASSSGVSITAASTTGTYPAWANVGSTLALNAFAVQFVVQGVVGSVVATNLVYHFQFGFTTDGGTTVNKIGPTIFKGISTNECGHITATGLIYRSIPAGAQLMCRAVCSGVAQALDVAAYTVH